MYIFDNQACNRNTFINLNSNQHYQRLRYHPFMVSFNKCNGSCNFFDDFLSRVCVANKIKDVNLNIFI